MNTEAPNRPVHDTKADKMRADAVILKRARKLWDAHSGVLFGAIVIGHLLLMLLSGGSKLLIEYTGPHVTIDFQDADYENTTISARTGAAKTVINDTISFVFKALLWPVTVAGIALMTASLSLGKAVRKRDAFQYYRSREGRKKSLVLGFLYQLIALEWVATLLTFIVSQRQGNLLPFGPGTISASEYADYFFRRNTYGVQIGIVGLVCAVLSLFIGLRLTLVPYLMVSQPDLSIRKTIASSWRAMRGNCVRAFMIQWRVGWQAILSSLALLFIGRFAGSGPGSLICTLLAALCIFAVLPCMRLAEAGLALRILGVPLPIDASEPEEENAPAPQKTT